MFCFQKTKTRLQQSRYANVFQVWYPGKRLSPFHSHSSPHQSRGLGVTPCLDEGSKKRGKVIGKVIWRESAACVYKSTLIPPSFVCWTTLVQLKPTPFSAWAQTLTISLIMQPQHVWSTHFLIFLSALEQRPDFCNVNHGGGGGVQKLHPLHLRYGLTFVDAVFADW